MNEPVADRITGLLGMVLSTSYVLYARTIEDSMLSDAVGAAGVPIGVAGVMFLASLGLVLKTWTRTARKTAADLAGQEPAAKAASSRQHWLATGLLALLLAYVIVLPVLGYIASVGLLVGCVAWFAGARKPASLLLCMLVAGPFLWLLFDLTLGIRMPLGLWPQWMAR